MAAMTPLLMAGNIALSAASDQRAANQLAATQALEEAQSAEQAALKTAEIQAESAADKAARKAALKKAVASRKAGFGAQGVASDGGSSEAVLLGQLKESEREQDEEDATTALKRAAIEQNLAQEKALNVLQRSQLEAKDSLSLFDDIL